MPYSPSNKPSTSSTSMDEPSYLRPVEQPLKKVVISDTIPKRFSFYINDSSEETIAVVVRLKGCDQAQATNVTYDENENCVIVKKNRTEQRYQFTHVFSPEAEQVDVFEKCTKCKLQRLLDGKHSFIFTYGVSNSGKSYTVHGKKNSPGLIPRSLVLLFSSLKNCIVPSSLLVPEMATSVIYMSAIEISERLIYKKKIVEFAKQMIPLLSRTNTYIPFKDIEELQGVSNDLILRNKGVYSIWISYYEIYNEKVYDLLDLLDESKDTRAPLQLRSDKDGQFYIKDLKHIEVNSLHEAYLVYTYGRQNLSVYSTGVNNRSSRSHSVFTLKLIGQPEEGSPSYFQFSSFSICDLAGTERANRTKNIGIRLKEAQRINTSFLVLNKCLRIIRENQDLETKKLVPYRESKLTQLLGPAFTSSEVRLTMIVTIIQDDVQLEETEGTLKSSSVATSIRVRMPPQPERPKKKRFSSALSKCRPGESIRWADVASKNETKDAIQKGTEADVYEELLSEKKKRLEAEEIIMFMEENHKREIEQLKENLNQNIGQMTSEENQIRELEEDCRNLRIELLKEKKVNRITTEDLKEARKGQEKLKLLLDNAMEDMDCLAGELVQKDEKLTAKEEEIDYLLNEIADLKSEISNLKDDYLKNIQDKEKQISELEKRHQVPVLEISDEQTPLRGRRTSGGSKKKANYRCRYEEIPKIVIDLSSEEEKDPNSSNVTVKTEEAATRLHQRFQLIS